MKHFGAHTPALQICPGLHGVPSARGENAVADVAGAQTSHELAGLTASAGYVFPATVHAAMHAPLAHVSVAVQALSQPPQCVGSSAVLTHAPAQRATPALLHVTGGLASAVVTGGDASGFERLLEGVSSSVHAARMTTMEAMDAKETKRARETEFRTTAL
jgi:hypothetical protein